MSAPIITAEATEVERIEDALDALLTAALEADRKPPLGPDKGLQSAGEVASQVIEAMSWTQARRQADRLLDEPVPTALRLAIRTLGRRLNEIGGHTLMLDVMYRVASRDPAQESRRDWIIEYAWDGIGSWLR